MGGIPTEETFTVDGRVNANGMVVDSKMDYISCSAHYKRVQYERETTPSIFDKSETVKGVAGI